MAGRERRRVTTAVLDALRDLRTELAVYSHRVGATVELKDIDFDCLDVIARHGPIGPTALGARVGVHAATMTGVLSRLEAAGWITRVPVENDRRAVRVTTTPDRQRELFAVLGGMQARMGEICEGFSDEQLATIADFLGRTVEAGRAAADELGRGAVSSPAGRRGRGR